MNHFKEKSIFYKLEGVELAPQQDVEPTLIAALSITQEIYWLFPLKKEKILTTIIYIVILFHT